MALVLGFLLAGCGHQASDRTAVAAYLKKVNKVEAALARPVRVVSVTVSQFSQEQRAGGTLTNLVTGSNEQALLAAWTQIRALRARLAAIITPPPAGHLRSLLLQVTDGQAHLTREVARLVAFLPPYTSALRPLAPATVRLELTLSRQSAAGPAAVAAVYSAKAAALRQFKAVADRVLRELRGLEPPAVSRPDYEHQIAALRGMSSNAGRLADALGRGAQGDVRPLLLAFDQAARSTQSIGAQKARIAAVKAYDAQTIHVAKLAQQAELERLRLANNLR